MRDEGPRPGSGNGKHGIKDQGVITTADWHEIIWEIRLDRMRVIVDDEVRFDAQGDCSGIESAPIGGAVLRQHRLATRMLDRPVGVILRRWIALTCSISLVLKAG